MSTINGANQTGVAEFSYPKEVVLKAVQEAVGLIKGMKLKRVAPEAGLVEIKTGMSAFSYGENVDLSVVSIGPWQCQLKVASSAKVAFNITAGGSNQKNYRDLVQATANVLERNGLAWAEQMGLGSPGSDNAVPSSSPASVADEMKKLLELLELGALTQEEFTQQKSRLLNP